ncbi:MAG: PAS domain S-box protein [Desulfobacula sp.]|jgi:PAS domain S-box-containing protein|uniref:PAS domain S-box protein n=1 Tax=Desulfobacula sp. TaxID=2593537 RepID=UPI001E1455F9|nr:PAS domain S-box protein [Desulfobacula sp.]MBT3487095.1 PAS domain S-box protein [Desulfobacula sp.]MBT3805802.1 PAS domain S-box protein [Desulfobacula sp.]MBT4024758.1 PAS domain S-box protein [Desulfobacula sp.]MBT4200198.1 PAS domain S-box protein [Desulfobacula sp.]
MEKKYSYFEKIKCLPSVLFEKMLHMGKEEIESLSYWRARILFSILFPGVLIGLFIFILAIPMLIKNNLMNLLIFYAIALIMSVFLLISAHISFAVRAAITLIIVYGVGLTIIIFTGPLSGGPAWLFCFSIFTGILLGSRAALTAVLINAITLSIISYFMINKNWGQSFPFFVSPQRMYLAGISFLFLNALLAICVSVVVKGVTRFHEKEKNLARSLKKEQARLIAAKNKLEKEFQDRIHKENELFDSEKRFRMLFEEAPDTIFIIAMDDRIIDANKTATKMLGYVREEFQTMTIADIQAPEVRGKPGSIIQNRLTQGSFFEALDIHKNGTIVPVEVHHHRMRIEEEDIVLSVVRDITERKQAEKEKRESQKIIGEHKKLAFVGQIAGKIAHDFNNILGVIMGNTELALMDCKETETRKTLELIFKQTLRGKNLTRNLVAFAKDQEPKQEFFRISDKIDLVINLLKKDLDGIEVIKENKPGVPEMLADPGMIEHAIVNLIQNSIHATSIKNNPCIILRTYNSDENICFEIQDNGCGIPRKHLARIYEPSFTLKGTRDVTGSYKPGIKGTGYGMANVNKYIEQHKGLLQVESEIDKGTKFTISMPIIKKELTIKEKKEIQNSTTAFEKYILLTEDEKAISDVQYGILTQEPCNHRVDKAFNGQAALDLFKKNNYDLVSLDYILPGKINGMDVYNHIRENNKTIPILFISGNIEFLESIKELKQKDAHMDHLSKPCRNKDYLNRINQLL